MLLLRMFIFFVLTYTARDVDTGTFTPKTVLFLDYVLLASLLKWSFMRVKIKEITKQQKEPEVVSEIKNGHCCKSVRSPSEELLNEQ